MSVLGWIVVSGLAMSALALIGGAALFLPPPLFSRVVLPMVALAAGTLLGGALFHMLPESIAVLGNQLSVYLWRPAWSRFMSSSNSCTGTTAIARSTNIVPSAI
ncbi:hypothetical protein [Mycolicibacterium sp. XJ879]